MGYPLLLTAILYHEKHTLHKKCLSREDPSIFGMKNKTISLSLCQQNALKNYFFGRAMTVR